ncbi:hypothetical protein QL285_059034 [Trifolium repens]|nr:hypothetical protein QL285_059034 [Trifolium repens]
MPIQRYNRNGRGRDRSQQHQWTLSTYQQHLWTTAVYPKPQQHWAYPWTPPCQYLTTGAPYQQSGILGLKPQQTHMATAPTHINVKHSKSDEGAVTCNSSKTELVKLDSS